MTIAVDRPTAQGTWLAYAALAVSVVGVGSALIFVRLSEVDPTATLLLRMVVASAVVGAVTAAPTRRPASQVSRRDLVLLAGSSVVSGLDLLANQWAVHYTSVANTVFLMNLSPVFVLLIAWLVYGERCSPAVLPAVPLALAGGALVAGGGAGGLSLPGGRDAWGITLALTSAVLYAVYLRLTKDLRSRLPTSLIMLGNSVVIAVMLAPLAFATSSPLLPHGAAGYLVILGYALVSQLLGHGLMAYALRGVSAGLASMSALLRPVVAVALAWLVLGETAGPLQLAGGLVLLAALAWFQLADRRPPVPDKVTGTVTGTVADRVADRVADKGD